MKLSMSTANDAPPLENSTDEALVEDIRWLF